MKSDLLYRARDGLKGARRPKVVFLRRSVSDAYYALFHAIAELCADELVGKRHRSSESWVRIYRGFAHGHAKSVFEGGEIRNLLPITATAFVQLQRARHRADYDPRHILRSRQDAFAFVLQAEAALSEIATASSEIRRELASRLIVAKTIS
jgi:uncharacterized protein (UPF0332 family)